MKKYLVILGFCAIGLGAQGQSENNGRITGKIKVDNNKATDNATVSLLRSHDSVMIRTALPDKEGLFVFENVKFGRYILTVSQSGYKKHKSDIIIIDEKTLFIDLLEISLFPNAQTLSGVTIEARKPFVERRLDKLIVNVENSIAAAGSSVLEVLERSPGVLVNQETAINLQGKQGVIVLIDGKTSPLTGIDLIAYLKGIPASTIATIEIITQPSARYDASGNAGIINIKFKKDQRQGLNGAFTLSYGQGYYYKPSASANFNYRKKKLNLFGSLSHIQPTNFTRLFIKRKFFDVNRNLISTFEQNSFIKQQIASENNRLGADYFISKKTVLGILFNGNWNVNDRNGNPHSLIILPNGQLDYSTKTNIKLHEKRFNGFGNFNMKHTFDSSGKELTTDLDFGKFRAHSIQDINTGDYDGNDILLRGNILHTDQRGMITVKSFKSDYVQPIMKGKFEAGIKVSLVQSDNDLKFVDIQNGQPIIDNRRSNHFIYDENVNAAYISFVKELKKFDIQIGLRIEQTSTKGLQIMTGERFKRSYVNLFPSFVMNKMLSEKQKLSISYAKRIDRPSYRQLNPFQVFVDPYTYVVGDPSLIPVITNSYELSHTFKNKYVTTLSYSKSKNVITDIFVQDDVTKISYQTPANIQDFKIWNLQTFIPFSIRKWLNATVSGNVYWNEYNSPLLGGNLENKYASWDVRLTNSFVIGKKGWSAELNGFYQAKNAWGLFVIRNLAQLSSGIQKLSKNKNSTFKFAVTDIFYTNHISVEVKYQNMDFFTDRTWDSRVATLSFTHRFGRNTITRARQRNSGVEDERRRAN